MAARRMFATTIIDSDAFLDMPATSQLLYFHLAMRADDDGFINKPKSIMRSIGACEDDLKLLFAKKFVLSFDSGIVVIKHWKIHNYIRKDMYTPTKYKEEMLMLQLDENNAYTFCNPSVTNPLQVCNEVVTSTSTQDRLGKDRLGKDSIGKDRLGKSKEPKAAPVVYFPNDELLENSFKEYIKMRKRIKAPMTEHAIDLLINKLQKLATVNGAFDNELAIEMLDTAVINCWKSVYPINNRHTTNDKDIVSEWLNA